jgi:lactoylglutathione lyase
MSIASCPFRLTGDRRASSVPYVSLERGQVRIGAVRRAVPPTSARLPPTGVELVLEVDDVEGERDRIVAAGWPLHEQLEDRPWGLKGFRILDPAGYYLRFTSRGSSA